MGGNMYFEIFHSVWCWFHKARSPNKNQSRASRDIVPPLFLRDLIPKNPEKTYLDTDKHRWSRKKSLGASPRRKPGSRTSWNNWIPAFAGMTNSMELRLFTRPSNTDEHRFYVRKRRKDKRFNGTPMNADKHGWSVNKKITISRPGGHRQRKIFIIS